MNMTSNKLPILALGTPAAVYAQQSSAGNQVRQSGTAADGALHEAGSSVKHLYRATRDELSDATLTTKVKTALLEDKETKPYTIHVSSDQGTVTLSGDVGSPQAASAATRIANQVSGVRAVNNHLIWHTSAR
jgi:hyperosmotically inducible protein